MEQDEHQQEVNAPLQLDPISDPQSDSQPDCSQNEMSSTRRKITAIPISRVNAIMRSCPNLTTVKNDAIALTAKAAELFIQDLATKAMEYSENQSCLTYNSLANYIADSEYTFLKDSIPQKITVREYYNIINNENREAN